MKKIKFSVILLLFTLLIGLSSIELNAVGEGKISSSFYGGVNVTFDAVDAWGDIMIIPQQQDWSNAESVAIRIKNNTGIDSPIAFKFHDSEGEGFETNVDSRPFELISNDGTVTNGSVLYGNCFIPANFDGTIVIPFTTFNYLYGTGDKIPTLSNVGDFYARVNIQYNSYENFYLGDMAIIDSENTLTTVLDTSSLTDTFANIFAVTSQDFIKMRVVKMTKIEDLSIPFGTNDQELTFLLKEFGELQSLGFSLYEIDNVNYNLAGVYPSSVVATYGTESYKTDFNIIIQPSESPTISIDLSKETVFDKGSEAPDFKEYITVVDNVDGNIQVTDDMINDGGFDINTVGDYVIQFSVFDSDNNLSTASINVRVELSKEEKIGNGLNDNSVYNGLEVTYDSTGTGWSIIRFMPITSDWSNTEALMIRVVNRTSTDSPIQLRIDEANGELFFTDQSAEDGPQKGYLLDQSGNITDARIYWGNIWIPADFDGTLIIPFDAFNYRSGTGDATSNQSLDLNNIFAFFVNVDVTYNAFEEIVYDEVAILSEDGTKTSVFSPKNILDTDLSDRVIIDGLSDKTSITRVKMNDISNQIVTTLSDDIDWTQIITSLDGLGFELTETDNVVYGTIGEYTVTITANYGLESYSQTFEVEIKGLPLISETNLKTTFYQYESVPDFTKYITATDTEDGDITILISMINTSMVAMDTVGTFDVIYTVTDSDMNTSQHTITFTIIADEEAPVIVVDDQLEFEFEVGSNLPDFKDYFFANDNLDGDIVILDTMITGTVDISVVDDYELLCIVVDAAGNQSSKSITIKITDKTAPTLSGVVDLEVKKGKEIDLLANITATDNYDENVNIQVSGNYDLNKAGTYELIVVATDSSNNVITQAFMLTVTGNDTLLITIISSVVVIVTGTIVFVVVSRSKKA